MTAPFGPQTEQGQQVGEVDQPFCLCAFGGRQWRSAVLPIKQRLQTRLYACGEPKASQIVRHFDFDRECLRHFQSA
jgi:hypothetical protein